MKGSVSNYFDSLYIEPRRPVGGGVLQKGLVGGGDLPFFFQALSRCRLRRRRRPEVGQQTQPLLVEGGQILLDISQPERYLLARSTHEGRGRVKSDHT